MADISKTVCSELIVDGYHLIERREETLVDHMTIVIHSRSIDDRSFAVKRTLTEDKDVVKIVTETEMTHEEVEQFEEYWSNLWNPQATYGASYLESYMESSGSRAGYLAKKYPNH